MSASSIAQPLSSVAACSCFRRGSELIAWQTDRQGGTKEWAASNLQMHPSPQTGKVHSRAQAQLGRVVSTCPDEFIAVSKVLADSQVHVKVQLWALNQICLLSRRVVVGLPCCSKDCLEQHACKAFENG